MEEERKGNEERKKVVNHFEAGANCHVYNGNISGCIFALPGATVTQQAPPHAKAEDEAPPLARREAGGTEDGGTEDGEELCHFIHPSVDSRQERRVHMEVKRLVRRQGIQEICRHLHEMRRENKVLLPQSPSTAYAELVRMGMPSGEGFNENTFRKYYNNR